jgi:hypothetical protein
VGDLSKPVPHRMAGNLTSSSLPTVISRPLRGPEGDDRLGRVSYQGILVKSILNVSLKSWIRVVQSLGWLAVLSSTE